MQRSRSISKENVSAKPDTVSLAARHRAGRERILIKNRQQYNAARRTLGRLRHEIHAASDGLAAGVSPDRRTEINSRISELEKEIELYDRLQLKDTSILPLEGFHSLPELLVAARIARGMTQKDLAEFMGMKMQQIQKYEAERYQSASLRRIAVIADALSLNIHQAGELVGERILGEVNPAELSSFPVGEMRRRGWLCPSDGDIADTQHAVIHQLNDFFKQGFGSLPGSRRRYARTSGVPHEAALSAWEARVLILADAQPPVVSFHPDLADARWLRSLVALSRERGGVKRVPQRLREIGIALIVERVLPGMQIDGAALRTSKGVFVVALTLRDPRLERFWVTLMHELSHLILHVGTGGYDTMFDEVGAPAASNLDEEADVFGREALIPTGLWGSCRSQYDWTRQAILDDARRLGVGPSVVVGHIRRLCGDVDMPGRLSANLDVRKQLVEAALGEPGPARRRRAVSTPSTAQPI